MRRTKLPPDTRLDWRDPEMPVYRGYTFADGHIAEYVSPKFEQSVRETSMAYCIEPDWRSDPTYNLRKAYK